MISTETWELIRTGGSLLLLVIAVLALIREDVVPGKTYRRAIAQVEELNKQADQVTILAKQLADELARLKRPDR